MGFVGARSHKWWYRVDGPRGGGGGGVGQSRAASVGREKRRQARMDIEAVADACFPEAPVYTLAPWRMFCGVEGKGRSGATMKMLEIEALDKRMLIGLPTGC